MVAEYVAQAIGFAIAAAAVEGYQVGARVVVFGVAAGGGCFVVDNGGLAGFGLAALKRLGGLDYEIGKVRICVCLDRFHQSITLGILF